VAPAGKFGGFAAKALVVFVFHTLHRGLQVYREPYDYYEYGLTFDAALHKQIQFFNSAVGQFLISFILNVALTVLELPPSSWLSSRSQPDLD
jgi:hypothetical protein